MNVGIDTSSSLFAAVLEQEGPTGPIAVETFHAKSDNPDLRRIELYRYAQSFFERLEKQGDVWVFCEEPLALAKNGKTTRLLGLAAGAIWAAHVAFDITWMWVDAAAWKGRESGIGLADWKRAAGTRKDKAGVEAWGLAEAAYHGLPIGVSLDMKKTPDLYDAWAILQWGQRRRASLDRGPGQLQEAREA